MGIFNLIDHLYRQVVLALVSTCWSISHITNSVCCLLFSKEVESWRWTSQRRLQYWYGLRTSPLASKPCLFRNSLIGQTPLTSQFPSIVGDNPQYKLTVHCGNEEGIVWILLTRHIMERVGHISYVSSMYVSQEVLSSFWLP